MTDSDSQGPSKGSNLRLVELEAEARHACDRYRLYRARTYGPGLTSPGRLRELERQARFAEGRLERAKAEQEPAAFLR